MDSFVVRGGNRLKGKIEISGSKNSALPILAACLMADGKTVLKGIPRLSDLDSMAKLIGELGCHVYRHEGATKVDGPALNGNLDIEVRDERLSEAVENLHIRWVIKIAVAQNPLRLLDPRFS